jgi:hypothetical protein
MFENSREAHRRNPNHWKNCADLSEDALAGDEFSMARDLAITAATLYLKATRKAEQTEIGKRWVELTFRESWNRFYWTIGKADVNLGDLTLGRMYLWLGASLENKEAGWYELSGVSDRFLRAPDFIKAFEKYLKFLEDQPEDIATASKRHFPRLLSFAQNHYASLGRNDLAGLAAKYHEMFRFLDPESFGARRPKHELFGLTGHWLLFKLDQPELALECFLDSLRLGEHGFKSKNLCYCGRKVRAPWFGI